MASLINFIAIRHDSARAQCVRYGFTLIELLVVITILLMVTAAAIPIMAPALENRRLREASRLVASFIQGARSRAIQTGRPVGVRFERFNGLPFAMRLTYVEVPPPYSGDTPTSMMLVSPSGQITGFLNSVDTQWQNLVRVGDTVTLGYHGMTYVISSVSGVSYGQTISTAPSSSNPWQLATTNGNPINLPAGYGNGVPFQIIRQPVRSHQPRRCNCPKARSSTSTIPRPLPPILDWERSPSGRPTTRHTTPISRSRRTARSITKPWIQRRGRIRSDPCFC